MADSELAPAMVEPADDYAEPAVGPYQRSPADLVKCINDWFRESSKASVDPRVRRKKNWDFYAGQQWSDTDKKLMEAGKRPVLTLNMILGIVHAVEGEERSNRQSIKVFGTGADDDDTAQGFNLLLKWIDNTGYGEFNQSRAFKSALIAGTGWVVPDIDYFDDPEGAIKLLWVDEDECFDDPLDTCPVGNDGRYFLRRRMMTEEEAEARWPGFCQKVKRAMVQNDVPKETDGSGYRDIYSTPEDKGSPKTYDAKRKLWAVMEAWWFQIEPGYAVVDPESGLLIEMSDDEFEEAKAARQKEQGDFLRGVMSGAISAAPAAGMPGMPAMPQPTMPPSLQAVRRPLKKVYQAFVSYDQLLSSAPSPLKRLKRFPYVPVRGFFDKSKRDWFGIVDAIVDPQIQHNVEQSVIVQLMQLMPKASWMGPKGSFHNKVEWETKLAQPGALLEYNGQRGKPEPIPVVPIPRHLIDMAFSRPEAMRAISGVNVEMTGQRQGSDAGVVMEQRKKAAQTGLAPLFDNFLWSKKVIGKVLISVIQTYMTPGRKIRVMGPEDAAQYAQATEGLLTGDYDTAIDETNSTVNDRVATMNLLQTTLPQMVKAGMPIIPEFIDLMPMAPHTRTAWKRQLAWQMAVSGASPPKDWKIGDDVPQQGGPSPQEAQVQMEMQMEQQKMQFEQQANQQKMQADAAMAQQKVQQDASLAQQSLAAEQEMAKLRAMMEEETARVVADIRARTALQEAGIKADTAITVAGINATTAVKTAAMKPKTTPAKKD